MKRRVLAMALGMTMTLSFATAAMAEEFNPDQVEDAMSIEEVREANGEEVPVAADMTIGAIAKAFSNEFWRTLEEGYGQAETVVNEAGVNLSLVVDGPTDETDEIGQQTMTDNMVNQGYSAIMASPISDSNLTASIEAANEAGITTVNVNDGLIAEATYYVGPNAYQNGQLAAEWVDEQLGGEGQVAIVIVCPNPSRLLREPTASKTGSPRTVQDWKWWLSRTRTGIVRKRKSWHPPGSSSTRI